MAKYQGFYNGKPMTTGNIGSNTKPGDGGEITYTPVPDPYDVYKATRPSDWLSMPKPDENTIYMLMLIPDGGFGYLDLLCSCTGSYKLAFGTVENGEFVSKLQTSQSSDSTFQRGFSSEDYDDVTSDGFKQVMVRITGTDIRYIYIRSMEYSNSAYISTIVDIRAKLPYGANFSLRDSKTTSLPNARQLRYFSLEGPNRIADFSNMFKNCTSLVAVLELDTSFATNMSGMFESCSSLLAIPELNTSGVSNMSRMFYGCSSLLGIHELDMTTVTTMASMFELCSSLKYVPDLNTEHVENMNSAFASAYSLDTAPKLDYSSATTIDDIFTNCYSLKRIDDMNLTVVTSAANIFKTAIGLGFLTLDPDVEDWDGCDITISGIFSRSGFVALFESLPTIKTPKTITLTSYTRYSYRGFEPLTDEDKEIATRKNWILNIKET